MHSVGRKWNFLMLNLVVHTSDHWATKGKISVIKTSQLMLHREIIAFCSQIHTKHINTVWAERRIVEMLNW